MKGSAFFNWIYTFLTVIFFFQVAVGARISIAGVINPVKEDGLLSVSCTVSASLDGSSQFSIFRTPKDSKTELLSVNDAVLLATPENIFLATRHMSDGSVIYFLTITQVKKSDEGEYSCKLSSIRDDTILALESVNITVNYFPDEGSPSCSPNNLPTLQEGSILTLNCTSDPGSPAVDIQWKKSDTVLHSVVRNTSDGQRLSELNYRVSMRDQNTLFFCMVSNPVFPEKTQTCHVGPLIVVSDGNDLSDVDGGVIVPSLDTSIATQPTGTLISVVNNRDLKNQCAEYCADNTQTPFQWKIATLVAVATAVVFLVCGILMFVMLKTMDRSNNNDLYATGATLQREQLYTELNQKFDDKVYIALQRQALKEPPVRGDALPTDLRIVRKY